MKQDANRPISVLIVDDEEPVRKFVDRVMRDAGYATSQAADGAAALEVASKTGHVDILVTDVMMPEMTGAELAAEVTRLYPEIGLLFVTGYVGDAGDAGDLAGRALLRKPFTVNALASAVAAELAGRLSGSRRAARGEAAE